MHSFNVDSNSQWYLKSKQVIKQERQEVIVINHIVLSNSWEKSAEVNQPINPLRNHNFLQVFEIQDVSKEKWTLFEAKG